MSRERLYGVGGPSRALRCSDNEIRREKSASGEWFGAERHGFGVRTVTLCDLAAGRGGAMKFI